MLYKNKEAPAAKVTEKLSSVCPECEPTGWYTGVCRCVYLVCAVVSPGSLRVLESTIEHLVFLRDVSSLIHAVTRRMSLWGRVETGYIHQTA